MPGKLAGASSPVGPLSERILAGFRRQAPGQRPRWQPVDPADPALGWQASERRSYRSGL